MRRRSYEGETDVARLQRFNAESIAATGGCGYLHRGPPRQVLVDAGLLRVVRTRRVKAIEEQWYGRTARTIEISPSDPSIGHATNMLTDAAREAEPAARRDDLRATSRHVRVPIERIDEFWERILVISDELTREPRRGDTVFGLIAAVYPTDQPTLPDPPTEPGEQS